MSLIIFFGMALFIFLLGVTVMGLTFRHWILEYKKRKKTLAESAQSQ